MAIKPDDIGLKEAEALIDHLVQIEGSGGLDNSFDLKLDLLERVIELLRLREQRLTSGLSFEHFIQSEMCCDGDRLRFRPSHDAGNTGSGTAPIRLQPKLLLFLLIYHRQAYRVLDIITKFVGKVWDHLDVVDFKRTETGVFRCYTNARFAAATLRKYGLLKFTRREAYKTWVLSLPGFLVASVVLDKYKDNWDVPRIERLHDQDLHDDVRNAWRMFAMYDQYIQKLASICEPHMDIFTTFEPVLHEAHALLEKYWKILQSQKMTRGDRQNTSDELLKQIEGLPKIEEFYHELSRCINLERVLGDIQ